MVDIACLASSPEEAGKLVVDSFRPSSAAGLGDTPSPLNLLKVDMKEAEVSS